MSLLTPTQYGQAQYNKAAYNLSAVAQSGSVDLADGFTLGDSIIANGGASFLDDIRINEWLSAYIIKGVNPWTPGTSGSNTWVTPPSTLTQQWTNEDAQN